MVWFDPVAVASCRSRLSCRRRLWTLFARAFGRTETSSPGLPDGHLFRSTDRDGGDGSLPQILDRCQVADEHPVDPVEEGHELLAEPAYAVVGRLASPSGKVAVLGGEGARPEELTLDVQRQVADPALHPEGVVVVH